MTERWMPIRDFSFYEISDHGRVRSLPRIVMRGNSPMKVPGKIMAPGILKKCGHRFVNLYSGAKGHSRYVHRLVAEAFIGDPPTERHQVAHWDGDTSNNHLSNLRWATAAENNRDAIRLGRNKRPRGTRHGSSVLNDKDLTFIATNETIISCRQIAVRLGVSHQTVSAVVKRMRYVDDLKRLRLI